jgi:hypothetical protein
METSTINMDISEEHANSDDQASATMVAAAAGCGFAFILLAMAVIALKRKRAARSPVATAGVVQALTPAASHEVL